MRKEKGNFMRKRQPSQESGIPPPREFSAALSLGFGVRYVTSTSPLLECPAAENRL